MSFNDNSSLILFTLHKNAKSSDLRELFFSFVENESFTCFHYRHRTCTKEFMKEYHLSSNNSLNSKICIFLINNAILSEFLDEFNGVNFMGEKLKFMVINELVEKLSKFYFIKDNDQKKAFLALSELNPPSYLPNGNVGTPRSICLEMISKCRMPTSVLKSLKLDVNPNMTNVPFNYNLLGETCLTKSISDSQQCEDWERHIQLHEDVDSQQRIAERPYETEKEVVWEKGSSGLVHYTDVLYWNEKAGKNVFDEDAVDDWDVDMAIYTDPECADRDSQELFRMREIEFAKRGFGHELPVRKNKKIVKKGSLSFAEFEKFSKGFGSQQLAKYGWTRGKPFSKGGLVEPLQPFDRKPSDKSGLGFLSVSAPKIRPRPIDSNVAIISTIYDPIDEEQDTPLQSAEPTMMKYRHQNVQPKKP